MEHFVSQVHQYGVYAPSSGAFVTNTSFAPDSGVRRHEKQRLENRIADAVPITGGANWIVFLFCLHFGLAIYH